MPSSDDADVAASLPRSIAALWGRSVPTTKRGPRPALTVRDIARAAVSVADERGWEAVSMKAIADAVGLSTMALYRYVDSKADIIDLLVDEAYGPADDALGTRGTWRERIGEWAMTAAADLRRRPWLTEIPMSRPPVGPNVLSWTEAGIRCFDGTALSGQHKMNALLLVDGFVRQTLRQATQMGLLGSARPESPSAMSYEEMVVHLIDDTHYPALLGAVGDARLTDDNDDFVTEQLEFGLEVILDGLAHTIERA
ncbi:MULTISPECIES: TetR/AcrR family transcriptional regulator [unclassified Gordonia (in: high G+C Gram-positive bacteria)]